MANPLTYEIMTPESVGVPKNSLVLGKHSGRRALEHRLVELGHTLSKTSSTRSTPASPSSPTARKPSTTRTSSACCNQIKSLPVAVN